MMRTLRLLMVPAVGLMSLVWLAGCAQQDPATEVVAAPPAAPMGAMVDHHDGHDHHATMPHQDGVATTQAAVRCPIMGGAIDKAEAASAVYDGKRYYFCCGGCPEKFLENPEQVIAENPEWAETAEPVEAEDATS